MPKFYLTTPVYYINDLPHIGHAYTTVVADVLARWHRLKGNDVFFLTGLDENSVKTVQAAKERGYEVVKKYADKMAENWKEVWQALNISNDGFIRTTEERHKKTVENFFMKVFENGDIYKGEYEGLYCEGCEAFYTESDLVDGKCPLHKTVPKRVKEENYFFRLSKYQDKILKYVEDPDIIQPSSRRSEVISFIRSGLRDTSVSRPSSGWGIPVPVDKKSVLWVWFDALLNYISGVDEKYWPADLQIVGKDILRFHCIIWPGMLLSAGYKLPKKFLVHGFLTVKGQKISKSLGNAIDPVYLAKKYSADALRYFLIRDIPLGEDGDFSEEVLITRLNDELADILGNLVHRVLSFIYTKFNGEVPKPGELSKQDRELISLIESAPSSVGKNIEELNLGAGLREIIRLAKTGNKYFNDSEPWRAIKVDPEGCATTLYVCSQLMRSLAIILLPYLPSTSEKIWRSLDLSDSVHDQKWESAGELVLKPGHKITKPEPIFEKMATEKSMVKPEEKSQKKQFPNTIKGEDFAKLDIKIGKILEVERIPKSKKLLKISVDLGTERRTIVAGLAEHYSAEQLVGKHVAVVLNMEPVQLMGVKSEGMLLAAEDGEIVSILTIEKSVKPGSKVR
jgi:methionyl-tRNA synthetase